MEQAGLSIAGIESVNVHDAVSTILSDEKIFGVNLYGVGLGSLTEGYFAEMIREKGWQYGNQGSAAVSTGNGT